MKNTSLNELINLNNHLRDTNAQYYREDVRREVGAAEDPASRKRSFKTLWLS
jgi:hypothetical protein